MKYIRDKPSKSLYATETSLQKFDWLCQHCGNHLTAEIEAARGSLRLNIPWRNSNVRKTAKHKYNLNVDDIHVYEFELTGEGYQFLRDCATSGYICTAEEGADDNADAEVGDTEDETLSMHDSTRFEDSQESTHSDALSSLGAMDDDTGNFRDSDSFDWASFEGQRDLSSPSSEAVQVDDDPPETPPWDSLSLASSSSDNSASVFGGDNVISRCTTCGEGTSAVEGDSRICPRQYLDLEGLEDWVVDGCGNLRPNWIWRRAAVALNSRVESPR